MARFEDGCYGSLKGIALIAKVLAGRCRMHYTRVAVGKGTIPEDMTPKALIEPPDYVMDAQISSVTNPVDGECQVAVQINSKFVEYGYYATWLILYAEDPDEGEVAFTSLCLENEPEWIRPSSSIVGKLAHFDMIAAVGDVDCVSATIDLDAMMTLETAKRLIKEHNEDPEAHKELLGQFLKAGEPGQPGSAVLLDKTGKLPAEVLPENTALLDKTGKLPEEVLPENAVLRDETGKIPASDLPENAVLLDEDGKVPAAYLPDEVFQQSGVETGVITIPAGAWQADPDTQGLYRAEIACEGSTNAHIPYVSLDGASMGTAERCGMSDRAEAADGVLRFWADAAPDADIIARMALFGPGGGGGSGGRYVLPAATAGRLGGVKVGSGLKAAPDGTLSVDTASEAEVNEMLAETFASDNK